MTARVVLLSALVVGGALLGYGWAADRAALNTVRAEREALKDSARVLRREQAALLRREDSVRAAYRRDTLWRTRTRVVVESLPGKLELYKDSSAVPLAVATEWVRAAVADSRACTRALGTCDSLTANLTSQVENTTALLQVAKADTRLVAAERDVAVRKVRRGRLMTVIAVVVTALVAR